MARDYAALELRLWPACSAPALMDSKEEASKEPGKSKLVTAGGRAVAVDWRRLKEVEAFFKSCETQAHSLPRLFRDSVVGADALQFPREAVASTGSSIDDQYCSSGARAIIGQAGNEPLGKFMTAGGRAVSVDTADLRKIQALFDSCETEDSKVSCGGDGSVDTAPPTMCFAGNDIIENLPHLPSPDIRDYPGHAGDVSGTDDRNVHHEASAMLCQAMSEPVGKFMTAGGRAVSVDTGHVSKVQQLFPSSEAEAINLLSCVQGDQVAAQEPALQLPRAEDQGCHTLDCHDLLHMLNPPSLIHSESRPVIGPADNDSATHGRHGQHDVFAMIDVAACESVDKFMTNEEGAVSATGLHELQASFEPCEPRASKLRSRSRVDSAVRDHLLRHQPSPDIRDYPGHAGDISGTDDRNVHHEASAMLCQAMSEPVGKFMTAGRRAVSVDTGHVSKVQQLFQSSEAEARNLLSCVQGDQVAAQEPALQLPRAEDQGCHTPDCHDLLHMLNPPSLIHSESRPVIGPADNDSATHGRHGQHDVFAMIDVAACESVDKFMTNEEGAVSTNGLHELQASFEPCEPRASKLRSRSRVDSAVRDHLLRHQPSPDIRDYPGHAGDISGTDDRNVHHEASAMLCQAMSEPVGKFMTAGGRAVSVDTGHVSKVQQLFQSSEAEAINLLSCVQGDQVAAQEPALQPPVVGTLHSPLPRAAPQSFDQAVVRKATACSQALSECSQNLVSVDRDLAHGLAGKLQPTSILREGAGAQDQPACPTVLRVAQDAVHFFSEVDGHSGMCSSLGKRLLASDVLASHQDDLEDSLSVSDISLIDWLAGKAPPSIVQGFAEECRAKSIEISSRYEDRWLRNHLAQLALLSLRSMDAASRDVKSICKRLGKRARAEIAGRRSAIFQICTGLAPADQHMVLMCTAPWPATTWLPELCCT